MQSTCRAQSEGLETADVERQFSVTGEHAPALRLLCACLCPLDDRSKYGPGLYRDFIRKVPPAVRQHLAIPHVLRFDRAALDVPEGKLFLLLALVEKATRPEVSGSTVVQSTRYV